MTKWTRKLISRLLVQGHFHERLKNPQGISRCYKEIWHNILFFSTFGKWLIYITDSRKTRMRHLGNKKITSQSVSKNWEETRKRQECMHYWPLTLVGSNSKVSSEQAKWSPWTYESPHTVIFLSQKKKRQHKRTAKGHILVSLQLGKLNLSLWLLQ